MNSFSSFLLILVRTCSLGVSNHSACINHEFLFLISFVRGNLVLLLFVIACFSTGHHVSDKPFYLSPLSELPIHVTPYVWHPTEFGDVSSTGTSLSIRLRLSIFCLSSCVDWPSLFLMFPCSVICFIVLYTLSYHMVSCSNLPHSKRFAGTPLPIASCPTIPFPKLKILGAICKCFDDDLLIVLLAGPFT